jgi:two-component system NarL family sensor kinase
VWLCFWSTSLCTSRVGIPAGRSAGVGLSSMHERAEELGGGCIVESTSEGGTRVLARLPLEKG